MAHTCSPIANCVPRCAACRTRFRITRFAARMTRLGVDVPSLHLEAFRAVRELIERVRVEGKPRIQLVLGDPGEGKTHLLCRLRTLAEDSWKTELPYALAAIAPLREPLRPFGHILREATASLAIRASLHRPIRRAAGQSVGASRVARVGGRGPSLAFARRKISGLGRRPSAAFLASFVQKGRFRMGQGRPVGDRTGARVGRLPAN